jgi:DNA repair exonuclease SbcCD ATPase subunit
MDAVDEELERWIERAKAGLARLPAGSAQERHFARAIRRMELGQLRRQIQRAQNELRRLPGGSDEARELAQALEQMDDEYLVGLREMLSSHEVETDDRTLAEVRSALAHASLLLTHPTAQAGLRDAIAETERALVRLKEYEGRAAEP